MKGSAASRFIDITRDVFGVDLETPPAPEKYHFQFSARPVSMVGYVPQMDAICEYWLERGYVFYTCPPKMGTTLGVCPIENFSEERLIPLGEL